MSDTAAAPPSAPFLVLPGFLPDALPYALRTTVALLLAYGIGFYAQLPTASSAGITVGIIAQASTGMSMSKAYYRVLGTIIGCIVSLVFGAAFAQDRTMLLACFCLWMGLCSGVATILRDFRSYGAALSGYTVAIIAIGGIDDPDGLLLASLNRTAAILLGIGSVALVNSITGGTPALSRLVGGLRTQLRETADLAADALDGKPIPDGLAMVQRASTLTGFQTDAVYAAAEQVDGAVRRRGAQAAIASLLTVISASRTVAGLLDRASGPEARAYLAMAASRLRQRGPYDAPEPPPTKDPFEALVLERAATILTRMGDASAGFTALNGLPAKLPPIVLRPTHDLAGAFISFARTVIAVGATAAFIVLSGQEGATLAIIQQAAFVGLLGASPTPAGASIGFLLPLLPIALVVGLFEFLVLPLASGFIPFCLVAGGLMFTVCLLSRQARLAPMAAAALIYVALFLSPSNPQSYDLSTYGNTVLQVFVAVLFTLLAFILILPVSPKRRLYRVGAAIGRGLKATLRPGYKPIHPAIAQAILYDRLARALVWLGNPTATRRTFLSHLYRTGAADIAVNRARMGLAGLEHADDETVRDAAASARSALDRHEPPQLLAAATALLAIPGLWPGPAATQAVSGLTDLAYQEGPDCQVSRFNRLMLG